jgi:hypothetical protein
MEPYENDSMSADSVVDEMMPSDFDWRKMVRKYPLASLAVAGLGGYVLGRSRGEEILALLSLFAADAVSGQVNDLLGKDVL